MDRIIKTQMTNIIHHFIKSKLTIEISSSVSAGCTFDTKKNFYGILCALSSSIFLYIIHASISFFSVIYFILIRTLFIIFLISEPSNGSNRYPLVV